MYTHHHLLQKNSGNNSFSYDDRMNRLRKAEIMIPSMKAIQHTKEIELGTEIVIEEIDENCILHSCTGLKHIYQYQSLQIKIGPDIYIFDNHNHALYFRVQHIQQHKKQDINISLMHIDQHSDLNTPPQPLDADKLSRFPLLKIDGLSETQDGGISKAREKYLRNYTNYTCQISSFIKPFLHLYPKTNFTRIKSESQLLSPQTIQDPPRRMNLNKVGREILILDIDLDFRAPEMSIEKYNETIRITHQLIQQADLVSIATSPMFIDQEYALSVLIDLIGNPENV